MRQFLIPGAPHFDWPVTVAIIAPMPFVALETFSRAAIVAYEKISLLFFIAGENRHNVILRDCCARRMYHLRHQMPIVLSRVKCPNHRRRR